MKEIVKQVQKDSELLQGIDTVIVRVSNIETSRNWYVSKLGMTPIWDDPKTRLVVLNTKGPVSITLWQTDERILVNEYTASYPIFRTPDADALRQQLISRNVEVGDVIKDDYVMYFFFYDPDGNILEACQVYESV